MTNTKRGIYVIFMLLALLASLFIFTACDGANSSVWRTSVNVQESSSAGRFSISVGSASRGTRNRTFNLTAEELASINVASTSNSGEIILVISQNGELDGTEIRIDISNFDGNVPVDRLTAGRIRFSLQFEDIRGSNTVISWR